VRPRVGLSVRDSLFSLGFYVRILIAKESNTLLIARARRFHRCETSASPATLHAWQRFIS
jgi:hypothetical protein